jgi:phosphohistidine phosphatase
MKLYLVQHGEANSEQEDPDKNLSERGKEDVAKVAAKLKTDGVMVTAIFHSGKPRAEQTAQILADSLSIQKVITRREDIDPMDELEPVVEELKTQKNDLMLVGHMPFMSKLASQLLKGDPGAKAVDFQRGGVVLLEKEDDKWSMTWNVTPDKV